MEERRVKVVLVLFLVTIRYQAAFKSSQSNEAKASMLKPEH